MIGPTYSSVIYIGLHRTVIIIIIDKLSHSQT